MLRAFIKGMVLSALLCAAIAVVFWLIVGRIDTFNLVFFGIGVPLLSGCSAAWVQWRRGKKI